MDENFKPRYAPPGPDNPMEDYMRQRMISHGGAGAVHGAAGLAAWAPALLGDDPMTLWLARALSGTALASSADSFSKASNFNDARKMWSNTGMPGRPVPDNENALLRLMRLNQMYGGSGLGGDD